MSLQTKSCNNTAEALAIASVPMQKTDKIYAPSKALKEGTIFPELNLPFLLQNQSLPQHAPVAATAKTVRNIKKNMPPYLQISILIGRLL